MGYAPADDPQIAIYVVVDRPNVQYQDDAKYATRIVRNILTEVLPYMGIFMTEELTDKEREELEALQEEIMTPIVTEDSEEETMSEDGEGSEENGGEGEGAAGDGTGDTTEEEEQREIWKTFPRDPETGYAQDPNTGELIDPETGHTVSGGEDTPAGLSGATGNNVPEGSVTGVMDDDSPF